MWVAGTQSLEPLALPCSSMSQQEAGLQNSDSKSGTLTCHVGIPSNAFITEPGATPSHRCYAQNCSLPVRITLHVIKMYLLLDEVFKEGIKLHCFRARAEYNHGGTSSKP